MERQYNYLNRWGLSAPPQGRGDFSKREQQGLALPARAANSKNLRSLINPRERMEPIKNTGTLDNQIVTKRPKHTLKRFFKKASGPLKWVQLAGMVLLVGYLVWLGVSGSSYFALQKIEVVGDLKQLTVDEITQISQVPLGVNIFRLSLDDVERNILKLPWVMSVSVRRQAPQTLWIHVLEQKPLALLLADKLYFVSDGGGAFKEVGQELHRDLPVLTGFDKQSSLKEPVQLIRFLEGDPNFEMFGLSEIHYNDAVGFSIVTLLGPMEIKLGRENFDSKITRLKKIWSQLGPQLGSVRGIDLDYEDRAFVKL